MGDNQCGSCGFFCLKAQRFQYIEATIDRRDSERCVNPLGPVGDQPCCFLGIVDICGELREAVAGDTKNMNVIRPAYGAVLTKTRNCGEFVKWIPGHGPEHLAKVQQMSIQKMRAEVNEQFLELNKKLAALSEVHHQETRKDSAQQSSWQMWGVVVAIATAIASMAVAIFK